MPTTPALKLKDPAWEKLRSNSTAFVHIYRYESGTGAGPGLQSLAGEPHLGCCLHRGSEGVEFLLPFVAGFGDNHNSLDTARSLNATRGDWVLVYGSSRLSVIRQRDVRKAWTFSSEPIYR